MTDNRLRQTLADVDAVLASAVQPEIGSSLKSIRLRKALTMLNDLDSTNDYPSHTEQADLKRRLVSVQCKIIVGLFRRNFSEQDRLELLYHVDEVIKNWAWLYAHFKGDQCAASFRHTLSNLLAYDEIDANKKLLHGLERKFREGRRLCKDPFIMALSCKVARMLLESSLEEAIELYGQSEWALALDALTSKDSLLDDFVELEEKLEKDEYARWGLTMGPREAHVVRSDFGTQIAICRAAQFVYTGDTHLMEALNGDPVDMRSRATLAQDDFRAALQIAAGQDIELEGSILVRLADFHANISKLPATAHQLYLRAVHLAGALHPRLPRGAWYRQSVDAVQARRDALGTEETRVRENARKPILDRLRKELEKLTNARSMGNMEFVKFVFMTWPPRTEGGNEPPYNPDDPCSLSKTQMVEVIQRYHGNKNSRWGEEWRVLCEEIDKELTKRYNIMKGI